MTEQEPQLPDLTEMIRFTSNAPTFAGTYSDVYRGIFGENEQVAVKVIKRVATNDIMQRKIQREGIIWAKLRHQNIIPLYGTAMTNKGDFGAFISPWYQNGNASVYLSEGQGRLSDFDERLQLWIEIAQGVDYLHSRNITHGDLKPQNIIIDDCGVPKICDFGLVRVLFPEGSSGMTTTSPYGGTVRYISPEMLNEGATPTSFSDNWALGCIGLEIVYKKLPYRTRNNWGVLADLRSDIKPERRPTELSPTDELIWDLLEQCWSGNPEERPEAVFIVECFNTKEDPPVVMHAEPEMIQEPASRAIFIESSISAKSKTQSSQTEEEPPRYSAANKGQSSASGSQATSHHSPSPIRRGSSAKFPEGQTALLQLVVEQGDSRLTLRWDELNQQGHSLPWISTVVVDGKEISEGRGRGRTKAVARNQAAGVLLETLKERSANRNPSRPQLAEELRKMLN